MSLWVSWFVSSLVCWLDLLISLLVGLYISLLVGLAGWLVVCEVQSSSRRLTNGYGSHGYRVPPKKTKLVKRNRPKPPAVPKPRDFLFDPIRQIDSQGRGSYLSFIEAQAPLAV